MRLFTERRISPQFLKRAAHKNIAFFRSIHINPIIYRYFCMNSETTD